MTAPVSAGAAGRAGGAAVPPPVGVTVAVCTHARPEQLARALRSLAALAPAPAEVLVVDNAPPTDATRELVAREFPWVRYLREAVPGLDFARNRALREAGQPVVAFLDDDAVADAGWAAALARPFAERASVAVCLGRVEALTLESDGARLFEANGGFARGTERVTLPGDAARRTLNGRRAPLVAWTVSVGSGCSMAVHRDRVLAAGGFDDALDLGAALPGGGDLDILWRMLEQGQEVVYEPAALAWHEHRPTAGAAAMQIAEHNRALVALLTKSVRHARGRRRAEVLAFLVWRLVKPGLRGARRAAGRDPLPAPAILRLWWHCWRGLGAYPAAQRLAARRLAASGPAAARGAA